MTIWYSSVMTAKGIRVTEQCMSFDEISTSILRCTSTPCYFLYPFRSSCSSNLLFCFFFFLFIYFHLFFPVYSFFFFTFFFSTFLLFSFFVNPFFPFFLLSSLRKEKQSFPHQSLPRCCTTP